MYQKALLNLLNQSTRSSSRASQSQVSKSKSKKKKKLPKPRTPSHNEFKKSVQELGQELLGLEDYKDLP
ncbi:hypothetical protein PISMIDRAFT_19731 [Pisolithus microcarpus 441]|uniref:Uncharacterized protein n=1 Tax=Pisolithus microcarpus 441 TaxID=765257 RepID=A0A0C9Y1Y3_9AGAM|nr:hypothetical protein PISMIDRAFT_19731 [Pisolithus microcarpus 441]